MLVVAAAEWTTAPWNHRSSLACLCDKELAVGWMTVPLELSAVSSFARVMVVGVGQRRAPQDSQPSLACLRMVMMAVARTDGRGSGGGANNGRGGGAFLSAQVSQYKKETAKAHGDHGSSHHGLSCWSLCWWLARLGPLGLLARTRGPQTDNILGIMDDRSFVVGCCLGVMRQMTSFVCKNQMNVINSNRFISVDCSQFSWSNQAMIFRG